MGLKVKEKEVDKCFGNVELNNHEGYGATDNRPK